MFEFLRRRKMKKIIAMILAATCIFAFAGCGSTNDEPTNDQAQAAKYANATEVLTTVWDAYADDEKFASWGGNTENMVDGAPGTFDLAMTEELTANLVLSADLAANIDDAATLMHGMNLNTFTAAAFHTSDDAAAFADAYATGLGANQWMCGIPENYVIIDAGNGYVVTAFGAADLMATFEEKALGALSGSTVVKSGSVIQ